MSRSGHDLNGAPSLRSVSLVSGGISKSAVTGTPKWERLSSDTGLTIGERCLSGYPVRWYGNAEQSRQGRVNRLMSDRYRRRGDRVNEGAAATAWACAGNSRCSAMCGRLRLSSHAGGPSAQFNNWRGMRSFAIVLLSIGLLWAQTSAPTNSQCQWIITDSNSSLLAGSTSRLHKAHCPQSSSCTTALALTARLP
jgi:hypothetical protein